jgi:hypothetical protein
MHPETDTQAEANGRSPQPSGAEIHQLSRGRRLGILLICCTSLFIVGVDITGVNVALPSIGRDRFERQARASDTRATRSVRPG